MNINELLNTKYPIIQGGMAHIANAEFAAAVSNSGGLGQIGSGGIKPDELRREIRKIKNLTDKPFGVNLMLLSYHIEEMVQIILDEKVPVVTTGAGNPGDLIKTFKAQNIKVLPVIASPTQARRMQRLGADGVIAEGSEAGGHIGEMTTMTLIPQVVSQVDIPVVAAGGIGSGQQMFAAEILGASGVQLGTRILVAEEGPIHENFKKRIVKAKDNNVTVIGRQGGLPIRLLRNTMTRSYLEKEKQGASLEDLEIYTVGALKKAVQTGDVDSGSVMAGYVVGQIDKIQPMDEIITGLYQEYEKVKDQWKD